MIKFKIDVLSALKEKGYSAYKLTQQDKVLSPATIQGLRNSNRGESAKFTQTTLDTLCRLLDCQPGDIVEYVKD